MFEEIAIEKRDEIQDLSKQIDSNNLVYFLKGESGTKNLISFKGPLGFYRNTKDGHTTLKKKKKIKQKLNQI